MIMFKNSLFFTIILVLTVMTSSCDGRESVDRIVKYGEGNNNIYIPEKYIHKPIGVSTKQKINTEMIEIPIHEIKNIKIDNNISNRPILFRIYISSNKNDTTIDRQQYLVKKINESIGEESNSVHKYLKWHKIYTDNISYRWHIVKNKPPIKNSDIVATCVKTEVIEPICKLPGFNVTDSIIVENISITESQLVLHDYIRQNVSELVKRWVNYGQ